MFKLFNRTKYKPPADYKEAATLVTLAAALVDADQAGLRAVLDRNSLTAEGRRQTESMRAALGEALKWLDVQSDVVRQAIKALDQE